MLLLHTLQARSIRNADLKESLLSVAGPGAALPRHSSGRGANYYWYFIDDSKLALAGTTVQELRSVRPG